MGDTKIKINLKEGTFEIEGSESFVEKYWETLKKSLEKLPPVVVNPIQSQHGSQKQGKNKKKKFNSSKKSSSQKTQNKENLSQMSLVANPNEAMSSLANELGIKLDQLKDTISIKGNKIDVITSIQDSSEKQKMIKATLCILLLFEKFYKTEWTLSTIIGEKLREMGIQDLGNLASHLKNEPQLFRYRGSNVNREYKLTTTDGRKKALEILKNLAFGKK